MKGEGGERRGEESGERRGERRGFSFLIVHQILADFRVPTSTVVKVGRGKEVEEKNEKEFSYYITLYIFFSFPSLFFFSSFLFLPLSSSLHTATLHHCLF